MIDWLLDSDPAIRWQALRDLIGAPAGEVAAERARVATEGWGGQLLSLQDADGRWDGGTYRPGWVDESRPFFDAWTATHFSLASLRDYGLDPASDQAQRAVGLVSEQVRWDGTGTGYFDGETEPCDDGMALATGAYFGQDVDRIVERILGDQLGDGGWNCWADFGATVSSFHSTLCVLEGLLEWEAAGGRSDDVAAARTRGEHYLLQRRLFRRLSTGEVADPRFTLFSFPTRWYYDVSGRWSTSGSAGRPTRGVPRPCNWCAAKATSTGCGRWRTPTRGRRRSRRRAFRTASPAGGTPCGHCGCWPGGTVRCPGRHRGRPRIRPGRQAVVVDRTATGSRPTGDTVKPACAPDANADAPARRPPTPGRTSCAG